MIQMKIDNKKYLFPHLISDEESPAMLNANNYNSKGEILWSFRPDPSFDFMNFLNLDEALEAMNRDGFTVKPRTLITFLSNVKNRYKGKRKLDFGSYSLLMNNFEKSVVIAAYLKYSPDSKQVKALIKLYKD